VTRRTALVRGVQLIVATLVVGAALRTLDGQWDAVRLQATSLRPHWGALAAASGLVVATYLVLVATWRFVVNGMGGRLRYADAAYIWFVSALARYLGALWQVVALGALSQRLGAPPLVAASGAVVMTIVNVLTGFGVALATGASVARSADSRAIVTVVTGLAVLVIAPIAAPRVAAVASRLTGRAIDLPRLTPQAVWAAAAGSIVTWFTYGIAFHLLTYAVLGHAPGSWLTYVAVYTTAYLAGLLGLVPAGLGVAEGAMVFAFGAANLLSVPEATLVALVSRLWRTVLEIAPGLVVLAVRGRPAAAGAERHADGAGPAGGD